MATTYSIPLNNNHHFQSGFLYLQAAGSNALDGSAKGIHLRWSLLRNLGENHIPKANLAADPSSPYYSANNIYNKPNDFVRIYRASYGKPNYFPVTIDFSIPVSIANRVETTILCAWRYPNIVAVPGVPANTTNIEVRFLDIAQYNTIKTTINPSVNPLDFIKAYKGLLEIETTGKLMFGIDIQGKLSDSSHSETALAKVECISNPDSLKTNEEDKIISCRKTFNSIKKIEKIFGENIQYFRMLYNNTYPDKIYLETYVDFIIGVNSQNNKWDIVDNFGLSIDDATVYARLENPVDYVIDKCWPKYNDSDAITGAFKVNRDNYVDRWAHIDGLKNAVIEYLTLSNVTPEAIKIHQIDDGMQDELTSMEISYLKMLKLVALDYHVARILGLGHIDAQRVERKQFVYVAGYLSGIPLDYGNESGDWVHLYMTIPTSLTDYRLPPSPEIEELTYGIEIESGNPNPTPLTNPEGYSLYEQQRYINIFKKTFPYDLPLIVPVHHPYKRPFFETEMNFNLADMTMPILFGLDYKAQGQVDWVKPEISHDDEYLDHANWPETVPLIDMNPVYTHAETNEGIHEYALYGINWFSRVSAIGNIIATDNTLFERKNTLLPPLNFAVQLIKPEDPLIFTTNSEQQMLQAIPPLQDKTLARVTFDWNHKHKIAYDKADKVEIFFRDTLPLGVRGEISTIVDLNDKVRVESHAYLISSTTPQQTIQPNILDSDKQKYIGGLFSNGQEQFIIDDIIQPNINGNDPVFILRKNITTSVLPTNGGNQFVPVETYTIPSVNEKFLVVENMNNQANWQTQLAKNIDIVDFPGYTEVDPDSGKTLNIGGIYELATITQRLDDDGNLTGFYDVIFNAYNLQPHLETDVDWYKGIIRIPLSLGTLKKTLEVFQILKDEIFGVYITPLQLVVFDPTFDVNNVNTKIVTGSNIEVNFHPSYRVYLYADTQPGNTFNQDYLFPVAGEGTKQTIIAARSLDTTTPLNPPYYASYFTPPAIIFAREIQVPAQPLPPTGPLFATRPDFYGKATYTFDTKMNTAGNHKPFSLIFYKINNISVLAALYSSITIYGDGTETNKGILKNLEELVSADAAYSQDRWNDLVNCLIGNDGLFKQYVVDGYRFPLPDNPDTESFYYEQGVLQKINPFNTIDYPYTDLNYSYTGTGQTLLDFVKLAIETSMLPLTEQVVIYDFILPGLQTLNKKPLIRNNNGDLIIPDPSDPNVYHQAPMAVKYAVVNGQITINPAEINNLNNEIYVRFTDYTIDGASSGIYFYCAAEMTDRMETSVKSKLLGPIKLVNTKPVEAPQIKKVVTQLYNPIENIPTAVIFEINKYAEAENIKKYRIYRAYNNEDALSVRTMILVNEFGEGETLIDTFSDCVIPPYGELLFHRVIALREILNERNEIEYIPSQPSNNTVTNIVDVVNPEPPLLTYTSDPLTLTPPIALNNVVLSWQKTANNGNYILYKMNSSGNWQKIYQIKTNDNTITVNLADTDWGSGTLLKADDDDITLFHRFKVGVENASGLLNLKDEEKTI